MKFNKWTIALAALGVISLASAAQAEEQLSTVKTALESTTISGYVDTSAQWNFGTGNANLPPYRFNSPSKADGFNLDVFQLTIEKALDEKDWAAGYRVDLWAGPDASSISTQSPLASGTSDFAIRQAYVNLRVPVVRGIEIKAGVFDSIVGYESLESHANPNYTRSYGSSIEPTTHTGLLASYQFCEAFKLSAGVADTYGPFINGRANGGASGTTYGALAPLWNRAYNAIGLTSSSIAGANPQAESAKTYMGSFAMSAPESLGFLSGASLFGGIVNGFDSSELGSGAGFDATTYYVGTVIPTPLTGLRFGAAFDYVDSRGTKSATVGSQSLSMEVPDLWAAAGYVSWQATEKLSFHGRCEVFKGRVAATYNGVTSEVRERILATTLTAQYDLWKNVVSRLEFRWDHSLTGEPAFGGDTTGQPELKNAFMLAANVIYKF